MDNSMKNKPHLQKQHIVDKKGQKTSRWKRIFGLDKATQDNAAINSTLTGVKSDFSTPQPSPQEPMNIEAMERNYDKSTLLRLATDSRHCEELIQSSDKDIRAKAAQYMGIDWKRLEENLMQENNIDELASYRYGTYHLIRQGSVEARQNIARMGVYLDVLSHDPSPEVREEVLRQGYNAAPVKNDMITPQPHKDKDAQENHQTAQKDQETQLDVVKTKIKAFLNELKVDPEKVEARRRRGEEIERIKREEQIRKFEERQERKRREKEEYEEGRRQRMKYLDSLDTDFINYYDDDYMHKLIFSDKNKKS